MVKVVLRKVDMFARMVTRMVRMTTKLVRMVVRTVISMDIRMIMIVGGAATLHIGLPACLSVCLSVRLSACLPVCPSVPVSFWRGFVDNTYV